MLFTGLTIAFQAFLSFSCLPVLTTIVFSLAGLVNGVYAKSIDGINIVPTFVLQPLVYLGGIFYSVHNLPQAAQYITYVNPLFYLINGFRYGFLGIADIPIWISISVLLFMIVVLVAINWYLIRTGLGLKQ
jgi:ABC-2 type transport system permease protein